MTKPKAPPESEHFDAIAAADELAESLGATQPPSPAAPDQGESFESILESEVVALNALVEQYAARIAVLEDEIDRSRSRVEKQARVESEQRIRKMLCEFLEVLDDLDRALGSARDGKHAEAVIEGVELVRKSFLTALHKFGVQHRPCLGESFDPEQHDAVSMVAVADPAQNNRVIGVVQEGYAIGSETLRPARVAVGKTR